MELVGAPVHVIGKNKQDQLSDGKPVIVCRGIIRVLEKKEHRNIHLAALTELNEHRY